jgi:hypothetical protein
MIFICSSEISLILNSLVSKPSCLSSCFYFGAIILENRLFGLIFVAGIDAFGTSFFVRVGDVSLEPGF